MSALDFHIHCGPWKDPVFSHLRVDVPGLNKLLPRFGVEGAVVTTADTVDNEAVLAALVNEGELDYWFFPWVQPGDAAALAFLERERRRVAGLKLHPTMDRCRPTDPAYGAALDIAEEEGLPVLIHCGQWQEFAGFRYVIELAGRRPGGTFVMAHQGGNNAALRLEAIDAVLAAGRPENLYMDITGLGTYWTLARGIEKLGLERFVFGSDYPLGHPAVIMGVVDALELSEVERSRLLEGNARRLLDPSRRVSLRRRGHGGENESATR